MRTRKVIGCVQILLSVVGGVGEDSPVSEQSTSGHSIREFWGELPPAGRWLLSTVAVQTLGRGLTLPFTVIYLLSLIHI